jgi:hypothetical protein
MGEYYAQESNQNPPLCRIVPHFWNMTCKVIAQLPFNPSFCSCRYPGGPFFNPLGFANSKTKSQPMRWKEIKNGKQSPCSTSGEKGEASKLPLKLMLWGCFISGSMLHWVQVAHSSVSIVQAGWLWWQWWDLLFKHMSQERAL